MSQASSTPLDFSSIFPTTSEAVKPQIEALVEGIFQSVWTQVQEILENTEEYRGLMGKIPEGYKQSIKEDLVKGMLKGGNMANDKPRDIQKTTELCRVSILGGVLIQLIDEPMLQNDAFYQSGQHENAHIVIATIGDLIRLCKIRFGIK